MVLVLVKSQTPQPQTGHETSHVRDKKAKTCQDSHMDAGDAMNRLHDQLKDVFETLQLDSSSHFSLQKLQCERVPRGVHDASAESRVFVTSHRDI